MRRLALGLLAFLVAGAVGHAGTLWLLPRVIMGKAMSRIETDIGANRALRPPLADHMARSIVMPSPDIAYVVCVYDIKTQPLEIRAETLPPSYWSMALYGANTDNFLVINDRTVGTMPFRLLLSSRPQPADGLPSVHPPSERGIVLFRTFVADRAAMPAIDRYRAGMSCHPYQP